MAKLSNKEEFIYKAIKRHGDYYDYSKVNYVNNNTKITITCPVHGDFEQIPRSHTSGMKCKLCNFDSYKNTNDEFIKRAIEIYGCKYKYDLSNYNGMHTKVKIICPEHGVFEQTPSILLKGHGCIKCSNKNHLIKYSELFLKKANLFHKGQYDYSLIKYTGKDNCVDIICSKHGVFKQSPNNHMKGKGCPICKESRGEKIIRDFLIENNISFIREKSFSDCKYKKELPFDFYLSDYNICVEFNGIQHYKPISHFGGINGLLSTQKRDNIKIKYCIDKNIKLVIIKYDENVLNKLKNLITNITLVR